MAMITGSAPCTTICSCVRTLLAMLQSAMQAYLRQSTSASLIIAIAVCRPPLLVANSLVSMLAAMLADEAVHFDGNEFKIKFQILNGEFRSNGIHQYTVVSIEWKFNTNVQYGIYSYAGELMKAELSVFHTHDSETGHDCVVNCRWGKDNGQFQLTRVV